MGVLRRRHSLFVPWLMLHAALFLEALIALAYLALRIALSSEKGVSAIDGLESFSY